MKAEETIKDPDNEAGMDKEPAVDEVVNVDDQSQDDTALCQDRSKWFKQSLRPETPDLEWHKEPNENDTPEQPWFNEMINAKKTKLTHKDVMGSVIDFTNFTKHCLKKDKIPKVDFEGPTFKLMKGRHKSYTKLEYNFEQCYLALTNQLD
ncbi:hypothetical protein Tco_0215969 [Tanacetum coccineum]